MGKHLGIKENIAWNSVGNTVYLLVQWLTTFLVARILGFEDAGVFSLAISVSNSLSSISLYGIRSFQTSDVTNEYSDGTYIYSRIVTSFASMIVCIVFIILNDYSIYQDVCIILYMLFKIAESFADVFQGILQKQMRMDIIGKSLIIKGIIIILTFTGLIALFENLLLGVVAMLVSSVIVIIAYDYNKTKVFFNRAHDNNTALIKKLLIACMPLAIYFTLYNTFALVPRFFLEKIMGTEVLGVYASIAIPAVVIQVAANYFVAPMITVFANYLNDNKLVQFKKLLLKTMLIIIIITIFALIGFGVFGETLLILLFGQVIKSNAYLLLPIVASVSLTAMCWFLSTILTVFRNFKPLLISSVIALIILIFGSTPLIVAFGPNGASFILIIALLLQIVIYSGCIFSRIKILEDN